MAILSSASKFSNFGLLVLRIGLGAMMIIHGFPKLIGGPEKWAAVGSAMTHMGISGYFALFGFLAAISEAIGGALIILGLAFRPACLMLIGTMVVAATMHIKSGDGIGTASHAIELAFVFFGLFFVGPGRLSIDKG
ncbi:MAG: DoxX family protein [Bacteroidetes bacterium]|nr:DoxX family protein [Bacteroidota bacterium]